MIKTTFTAQDGRLGVVLGLTAQELDDLKPDMSIHVDLLEVQKELTLRTDDEPGVVLPAIHIVLMGGKTEQDLVQTLVGAAFEDEYEKVGY